MEEPRRRDVERDPCLIQVFPGCRLALCELSVFGSASFPFPFVFICGPLFTMVVCCTQIDSTDIRNSDCKKLA